MDSVTLAKCVEVRPDDIEDITQIISDDISKEILGQVKDFIQIDRTHSQLFQKASMQLPSKIWMQLKYRKAH